MNKLLVGLFLCVCVGIHAQDIDSIPLIQGIYGSPKPFWDKGYRLDSLGVNAIFVRGSSITLPMIKRARAEGLNVFVEFPTLNGKGYVETHPEAWAIDENGKRVEAAGWFMGVCPTEEGFRRYRAEQLRNLLREYPIDGIWLDYVHWHAQFEEPEPILPETCFCDHCLSAFAAEKKVDLPSGSTSEKAQWILSQQDSLWRDWRCEVIADWTEDLKNILLAERPGALLGLFHCPWEDTAFNGARRQILGLDYGLLVEHVDVFSPMVYHERMGRSTKWVEENLLWFRKELVEKSHEAKKIWPIVQAYQVPVEEFAEVLQTGLAASSGVMVFTATAVANEDRKIEAMRRVYHSTLHGKKY